MANVMNIEPFGGELNGNVQPKDFLKTFRRTMRNLSITSNKEWIECFVDYLASNSPTEEWYTDEGSKETLWQGFEASFIARFPGAEAAKKTKPELEREILEKRLGMEELNKTEMHLGVAMATHKIFADKLLDLAKCAKFQKTTTSIWQVHDNLPDILKSKVGKSHTDWMAFCKAIKDVDPSHIRDGVRKHTERITEKQAMEARLTHIEHLTSLTNCSHPCSTSLHNHYGSTASTATNICSMPEHCYSNPYHPSQPCPPATEEQKAKPNSQQGFETYAEQIRQWRRLYGDNARVSEDTGFPLTPGTAPPCLGKCYNCRLVGHDRRNCMMAEPLNVHERVWRSICGNILGHAGTRCLTAQVNIVGTTTDDIATWLGTTPCFYSSQGNGEGPLA
ncbi:hypothetical protein L208DRAFT_1426486 [Tricholoma matsutake]|nr:hypothetical protein L208DRAFT_1426486 [Tricholoma matsutake 945]